ncbi:hypothetical protein [Paenibacillus albus]|uniref:Uncharacterized protein n=1 Tax=Paenibacillus albus TaxID=2495582 RepID=A0A3S9A3Z2_9BACL|nr:hypothetical protein [Paenibacillus albus]AZN40448.1 hypothetical protein EJC50_12880 [Paenibacillus albus]
MGKTIHHAQIVDLYNEDRYAEALTVYPNTKEDSDSVGFKVSAEDAVKLAIAILQASQTGKEVTIRASKSKKWIAVTQYSKTSE